MDASVTGEDDLVVDSAPIANLLKEFVGGWRKQRPSVKNRLGGGGLEPVGPYEWLAAETGLPEEQIRAVVTEARRRPTIDFRVADALVASIGEPAMYYNGTLNVRPR